MPGDRGRPRRAGRGAHRLRQDDRRRVRHPPGAADRPQGVLHDADQGAVEPEVPRPGQALRRRQRRPADRRQRRQRRGTGGRDDHRGAAQHAVRRLADAVGPGLRRDGRGALPRRPDARRGLGGGHHPPAGVGDAGVALGDGLQRRGVRRVAGHRAWRDHHDPGGEAAGAALPARHGGASAARPVRVLRRRRERGLRQGGRPGQRGADPDRPRRLGQHPADARPALAAQGQARVVEEPARGRQRPSGLDPQPGRGGRAARPRGPAARRSSSSSAAPAATPRSPSWCRPTPGSPRPPSATRSSPASRRPRAPCPRRTCTSWATTSSSTGSPAASRPTTPACCRRSSRSWRSSSRRAWSRSSSRPRPSRWASTCRRAPSSSRSSRSGTARPTPT